MIEDLVHFHRPTTPPDRVRLVNGTRILLAALSPDSVVGLGVLDGDPDKIRGRYQITYLRHALDLAQALTPPGTTPTVEVSLSCPHQNASNIGTRCRCLVLTIGASKTAVVVAPQGVAVPGKNPSPQRYRYIGPASRVRPCKHRLDPDAIHRVCSEGDCPGDIDRKCPFAGETLRDFAADLFEPVTDEGDERRC